MKYTKNELREEINAMRQKLNSMISMGSIDSCSLMELSIKLDALIVQYYRLNDYGIITDYNGS